MKDEQLAWITENVYVIKNISGGGGPAWQLVFMSQTNCEPFFMEGPLPGVVAEAMRRMAAKQPLITGS